MTQKEFVPKHTYRTRSKPCAIRGTEMEMDWIGRSGEKARGVIYSTQRLVHDNPKNMSRTIQNASRKERRMATPMDERFRVLFRESATVRRLEVVAYRKALRARRAARK